MHRSLHSVLPRQSKSQGRVAENEVAFHLMSSLFFNRAVAKLPEMKAILRNQVLHTHSYWNLEGH